MIKNRGGTKVHSGHFGAGETPHIAGDGMRAGVDKSTPASPSYFGPSVPKNHSEDSLTSGAELRGGRGRFPRKADQI